MNNVYSGTPKKEEKQYIFQYFGLVPSFVLRDSKISFGAKAVYAYLATYINADQFREGKLRAWPSRKRMAKELNMSPNTLSKYLKELEKNKLIKIEQSRQTKDGKHFFGNNIYSLRQHIEHFDSQDDMVNQSQRNTNHEQPDSYATQEVSPSINSLPPSNTDQQSKSNLSYTDVEKHVSDPEPETKKSETNMSNDSLVDMVIDSWSNLNVNPHPRLGQNTKKRIATSLNTALEDFSIEEVLNSMQIYARVYSLGGCHHK